MEQDVINKLNQEAHAFASEHDLFIVSQKELDRYGDNSYRYLDMILEPTEHDLFAGTRNLLHEEWAEKKAQIWADHRKEKQNV